MMSQLDFTQAKAQQESGDDPGHRRAEPGDPGAPHGSRRARRSRTSACAQAFRLIRRPSGADRRRARRLRHVGNDLFGKGLPYFADDLPVREQDLEQAKSLLEGRGPGGPRPSRCRRRRSCRASSRRRRCSREQAKGAGVTVKVKKEAANAYFDTSLLYTHMPTSRQSFWTVRVARRAGTRRRSSRMRSGTRRTGATRRTTSAIARRDRRPERR